MKARLTTVIPFSVMWHNDETNTNYHDVLELTLSEDELVMLLFRLSPEAFYLSGRDYKVLLRREDSSKMDIIISNNEGSGVVTNSQQVIDLAFDEYKNMIYIEKCIDIVNLDINEINNLLLQPADLEDEFGER